MNNKRYLIIFLFPLLFAACKKSSMFYEGEEGVYFSVQWGHSVLLDTTVYAHQPLSYFSFINYTGQEAVAKLKVRATGKPKDYDRHFYIEVNSDSTSAVEGVHYAPLQRQQTIKAGTLVTDVEIALKRAADLSTQEQSLGIHLVASDDFTLSIPVWYRLPLAQASEGQISSFDARFHKLVMRDFVVKPAVWPGRAVNNIEEGLFGDFTEKKYRLICERFDLVYSDFSNTTTMPLARQKVINEVMARYLQNQYHQGTPVLEDDGRLMFFEGVSWTSTVGVRWTSN